MAIMGVIREIWKLALVMIVDVMEDKFETITPLLIVLEFES